MELHQFARLKAEINANTSTAQILDLEALIGYVVSRQTAEVALFHRSVKVIEGRTCPHCTSNLVVLHGRDQNGRQRFRCRACRRTYNILTGTPMARARKPEKWGQYLGHLTSHMSVRKIVEAGVAINP